MKIEINKNIKYGIISALIIIIGASVFFIFKECTKERVQKMIEEREQYESSLNFSQKAKVRMNEIYDKDTREAGELCITKYIEKLENTYTLSYTNHTNKETLKVNGDFQVKGVLTASKKIGENDEAEKEVWKKEFSIIENSELEPSEDGNKELINITRSMDLKAFNEIIEKMKKLSELQYSIKQEIIVTANINILSGDKKEYSKKHELIIEIPSASNYYIVQDDIEDQKNQKQEIERVENIDLNIKKLIFLGIISGLALIGLVFIAIYVKEKKENPREKLIKKIFNEYAGIMVALEEEPDIESGKCFKVRDIKDLVRISEELIKPMMYKYQEEVTEIKRFFVISNDDIYEYVVDYDQKYEKQQYTDDDMNAKRKALLDEEIVEVFDQE